MLPFGIRPHCGHSYFQAYFASMTKSVAAYLVNGRVLIAPSVRTTSGVGLEIGPQNLATSPDLKEVEVGLATAFGRSEWIVPHPVQSEWKGSFDPFLKAAGVRSLKAFMATAQLIYVDEKDGEWIVTPHRNLGAKEGFEPIEEDRQRLPDLSAVANAVLDLKP